MASSAWKRSHRPIAYAKDECVSTRPLSERVCEFCGKRMDKALVDAEPDETSHPSCDVRDYLARSGGSARLTRRRGRR